MASSAVFMQAASARNLSVGVGVGQACAAGTRAHAQASSHLAPVLQLSGNSEAHRFTRVASIVRTSHRETSSAARHLVDPRRASDAAAAFAGGDYQRRRLRGTTSTKSSFLGSASALAEQSASDSSSGAAGRGGALTAEANLFARIYRIFVSTVTGAVKSQEDPAKLLDQAVIDMEDDLGKVKQATAAVVGAQRQLEQKYNGASQVARMWYDRARLALAKGEEDLARRALEMRKIEDDKARAFKDQLDKQSAIATKLVANTKLLEGKIKEAQSKKDSLKYRAEAAKATQSIQEMLGQIDTSKAIYAFGKLEEDVLRAEAKADALSDLVTSDMDAKFAALESDSAVEDDLQQLRDEMRGARALPAPKAAETGGKSVFWKEYVDPRVERELAELRGQMTAQ